jgi:hypothetical protein
MKKLLSLMLVLAMCLILSAPAMAAVNWDDFYIISQTTENLIIPFGSTFSLEVKVNVPQGTEVTYQWGEVISKHSYSYKMEDATQPVFQCSKGEYAYPNAPTARPYLNQTKEYACTITAVEKDDNGNVVKSAVLVTQAVKVTVLAEREATKWEHFKDRWLFDPLFAAVTLCIGSYGLLIPVSPLIWLYFLIVGASQITPPQG